MTEHDQAVIAEAMRRANPDVDGDLMRWIERLDPETAIKFRALLFSWPLGRSSRTRR